MEETPMTKADMLELLDFSRKKTLDLLENIAKLPNADKVLSWRPGPGRAHIAWQLMHIAATDDRHVHVRMQGGEPQQADYVRRFAGGSVVDDNIPGIDTIRQYLAQQRQELTRKLESVPDADLNQKPNAQAPWTYNEWVRVLTTHEAHHHGQAHLTLNLYRATQDPNMPRPGH
jgi:uncharacterized damage-inducible protein DinB